MSDLRSLIRRGRDLDREIKAKSEELKTIKVRLISAGEGDHDGTDGASAKVTLPGPTLKPSPDAIEKVRRAVGEMYFARVFTTATVHSPVKGFRERIEVLLGVNPARELIAACEVPSAAQVRFSLKPGKMSESDFLDDIADGLDEAADLMGETFKIGGVPVTGDWTGAEEGQTLTTTGGKEEHLKGTLVLSRRRVTRKPEVGQLVDGPDGQSLRIHTVWPDAASWTLYLTAPNNAKRS